MAETGSTWLMLSFSPFPVQPFSLLYIKSAKQEMFIYVPDAELVLGHEAHGSERGVELPYLTVEVVRRPDVQLLLVGILLVGFK